MKKSILSIALPVTLLVSTTQGFSADKEEPLRRSGSLSRFKGLGELFADSEVKDGRSPEEKAKIIKERAARKDEKARLKAERVQRRKLKDAHKS